MNAGSPWIEAHSDRMTFIERSLLHGMMVSAGSRGGSRCEHWTHWSILRRGPLQTPGKPGLDERTAESCDFLPRRRGMLTAGKPRSHAETPLTRPSLQV